MRYDDETSWDALVRLLRALPPLAPDGTEFDRDADPTLLVTAILRASLAPFAPGRLSDAKAWLRARARVEGLTVAVGFNQIIGALLERRYTGEYHAHTNIPRRKKQLSAAGKSRGRGDRRARRATVDYANAPLTRLVETELTLRRNTAGRAGAASADEIVDAIDCFRETIARTDGRARTARAVHQHERLLRMPLSRPDLGDAGPSEAKPHDPWEPLLLEPPSGLFVPPQPAWNQVRSHLDTNRVCYIIGPSGAGKTELASRMLCDGPTAYHVVAADALELRRQRLLLTGTPRRPHRILLDVSHGANAAVIEEVRAMRRQFPDASLVVLLAPLQERDLEYAGVRDLELEPVVHMNGFRPPQMMQLIARLAEEANHHLELRDLERASVALVLPAQAVAFVKALKRRPDAASEAIAVARFHTSLAIQDLLDLSDNDRLVALALHALGRARESQLTSWTNLYLLRSSWPRFDPYPERVMRHARRWTRRVDGHYEIDAGFSGVWRDYVEREVQGRDFVFSVFWFFALGQEGREGGAEEEDSGFWPGLPWELFVRLPTLLPEHGEVETATRRLLAAALADAQRCSARMDVNLQSLLRSARQDGNADELGMYSLYTPVVRMASALAAMRALDCRTSSESTRHGLIALALLSLGGVGTFSLVAVLWGATFVASPVDSGVVMDNLRALLRSAGYVAEVLLLLAARWGLVVDRAKDVDGVMTVDVWENEWEDLRCEARLVAFGADEYLLPLITCDVDGDERSLGFLAPRRLVASGDGWTVAGAGATLAHPHGRESTNSAEARSMELDKRRRAGIKWWAQDADGAEWGLDEAGLLRASARAVTGASTTVKVVGRLVHVDSSSRSASFEPASRRITVCGVEFLVEPERNDGESRRPD